MFNLNLENNNYDGEYELYRSTSKELVNMYGVLVKYIKIDRINKNYIFGEWSHIKIDSNKIYEIYILPSEKDNWGGEDDLFSKFGLGDLQTLVVYIAADSFEVIHPNITNKELLVVDELPNNNLIVFQNNKVMEVTDFKLTHSEHGNNNIYTSNRSKNVYKLTLKSYIADNSIKLVTDDSLDDFSNLDSIFNSNDFDIVEETKPTLDRKLPIRDKNKEKNPFGDLG